MPHEGQMGGPIRTLRTTLGLTLALLAVTAFTPAHAKTQDPELQELGLVQAVTTTAIDLDAALVVLEKMQAPVASKTAFNVQPRDTSEIMESPEVLSVPFGVFDSTDSRLKHRSVSSVDVPILRVLSSARSHMSYVEPVDFVLLSVLRDHERQLVSRIRVAETYSMTSHFDAVKVVNDQRHSSYRNLIGGATAWIHSGVAPLSC